MSVFSKPPAGAPGPAGPQGPSGLPGATPDFSRLISAHTADWLPVQLSTGASPYFASVLRLASLTAADSHAVLQLATLPAATDRNIIVLPDDFLGRVLLDLPAFYEGTFQVMSASNLVMEARPGDFIQYSAEVARFTKRPGTAGNGFSWLYEFAQSPAPSQEGRPGRPCHLISASTFVPAWTQIFTGTIPAGAVAGAIVHTAAFPENATIDLRFGASPAQSAAFRVFALTPGTAGWPAGLVLGLRTVRRSTGATVLESKYDGTAFTPAFSPTRPTLSISSSNFLRVVVVTPPASGLASIFTLKFDAVLPAL